MGAEAMSLQEVPGGTGPKRQGRVLWTGDVLMEKDKTTLPDLSKGHGHSERAISHDSLTPQLTCGKVTPPLTQGQRDLRNVFIQIQHKS